VSVPVATEWMSRFRSTPFDSIYCDDTIPYYGFLGC
jgi:hypothetical protein